ncbi:MAG: hypothetical protein ACTTKL_10270 [Treponema sp.]
MRCSKSCHLCDLELGNLFDNEVIEQSYYYGIYVQSIDTAQIPLSTEKNYSKKKEGN